VRRVSAFSREAHLRQAAIIAFSSETRLCRIRQRPQQGGRYPSQRVKHVYHRRGIPEWLLSGNLFKTLIFRWRN